MSDPREVGRVAWPGGRPVAILLSDRTWHSDTPGLADGLAALYRDAYAGPADGRYGVAILDDLAAHVGGTCELADIPEPPAGTIY